MTVVRIKARIDLLTTAQGGRHSPVGWPYRPNHNFGTLDEPNFRMGKVEIPPDQPLHPGEGGEFEILFIELLPDAPVREIAWPGRRWVIQEGPKLVGNATVVEILN